ncbi:MAG: hypothetical protein Q4B58_09105 [Bacteroidales bacterium]|nr:hypothetical protein [Bacteroidales bacterium]
MNEQNAHEMGSADNAFRQCLELMFMTATLMLKNYERMSGQPLTMASAPVPMPSAAPSEKLFGYIHPLLDEAEAVKVDRAVRRLCMNFGMQEICEFLVQLKQEGKVLLTSNPNAMYDELVRMGLPSEKEGFSFRSFQRYYTVN